MRSGLKALILVTRQFGINIGPNDIPERYNVDDRELSLAELASVVQKFDLRAKPTKVNEPQLAKALLKKQQILRLSTGRYIIALRYTQEKDGSRTLLILDPSQPESKSQTIDINEVKKVGVERSCFLKRGCDFLTKIRNFRQVGLSGNWSGIKPLCCRRW